MTAARDGDGGGAVRRRGVHGGTPRLGAAAAAETIHFLPQQRRRRARRGAARRGGGAALGSPEAEGFLEDGLVRVDEREDPVVGRVPVRRARAVRELRRERAVRATGGARCRVRRRRQGRGRGARVRRRARAGPHRMSSSRTLPASSCRSAAFSGRLISSAPAANSLALAATFLVRMSSVQFCIARRRRGADRRGSDSAARARRL